MLMRLVIALALIVVIHLPMPTHAATAYVQGCGNASGESFDSLVKPIQEYADWLWALRQEPVLVSARQAIPIPAPPLPPRPLIAPPIGSEAEEWCRRLSERESEVLSWLGQGRSVKSIAEGLGLSAKTVGTYRARLLDKLHLGSTGDLMRFAILDAGAHEDLPPSSAEVTHKRARVARSRRSIEREEWPG